MANEVEKSLLDIDFAGLTQRTFTPSPAAWEDQVLYFLLLDRFSDGNERGGRFGGLCSHGRHFFNKQGDLYRALAALMALRKKLLPLRRGRQALHRISGDGATFGLPRRVGDRMRSLVAWSRLFVDQEVLVAVNTDDGQPVTAYSTVAPTFRVEGDEFHLVFWYAPKSAAAPPPSLMVERRNRFLAVQMTLPPAGFAIYQAAPGLDRLGPSPPPDLKPWQPRVGEG